MTNHSAVASEYYHLSPITDYSENIYAGFTIILFHSTQSMQHHYSLLKWLPKYENQQKEPRPPTTLFDNMFLVFMTKILQEI